MTPPYLDKLKRFLLNEKSQKYFKNLRSHLENFEINSVICVLNHCCVPYLT